MLFDFVALAKFSKNALYVVDLLLYYYPILLFFFCISTMLFLLLFSLYIKNKRRIKLLLHLLSTLQYLQQEKQFYLKKIKKRIRKLKGPHKGKPRKPTLLPRNHGPHIIRSITDVDIFQTTGLFEDAFEWIFIQIEPQLLLSRNAHLYPHPTRKCNVMLEPRCRLLLVLHWLRHYPKYLLLQEQYQVSKSFISRDIKHITPILYTKLNFIKWPEEWIEVGRFGTHGAEDGTPHYRWRVHPGQAYYYRGDKHAHLLGAQVNKKKSEERTLWNI